MDGSSAEVSSDDKGNRGGGKVSVRKESSFLQLKDYTSLFVKADTIVHTKAFGVSEFEQRIK